MSRQADLARKCCARAEDQFEMQYLAGKQERGTIRHLHSELMEVEQKVQRNAQLELGRGIMRAAGRGMMRGHLEQGVAVGRSVGRYT